MICIYECSNYCVASLQAPVSACWAGLLPASSLVASPGIHMVPSTGRTPAPCRVRTDQAEHGDLSPVWNPVVTWLIPLWSESRLGTWRFKKLLSSWVPLAVLVLCGVGSAHQAEELPTAWELPSCHCSSPSSPQETSMLLMPGTC